MNLVNLVFAIEEGIARNHLKEHATVSPDIHFMAVVPIGHEALGGTVPSSRDVFCIRMLTVNSFAGSKVSQFYFVTRNQHILWFYVAVEYAFLMRISDGLEDSMHIIFDFHRV